MPLVKSRTSAARSRNIATEIRAGRPPKQAAAIAYSVQRAARKAHNPGLTRAPTPVHQDCAREAYAMPARHGGKY